MFVTLENDVVNMNAVNHIHFDNDTLEIALLYNHERVYLKYSNESSYSSDLTRLISASQKIQLRKQSC